MAGLAEDKKNQGEEEPKEFDYGALYGIGAAFGGGAVLLTKAVLIGVSKLTAMISRGAAKEANK